MEAWCWRLVNDLTAEVERHGASSMSMTTADTVGLAWSMVVWLLSIGWIPVAVEMCLSYLFQIEDRFPSTLLIIPYMEFVTVPFTFLAALIALYKGVKGTLRLLDHDKSESHPNRNSQKY